MTALHPFHTEEGTDDVLDVQAPWTSALTGTERSLILFGLAVATLALIAMVVRTWMVRGEVSGRYRPAITASLALLTVAALAYVVLLATFTQGYRAEGGGWTPRADAMWAWGARYMDWAVTVPLLVVELVAVSALTGATAARTRAVGIAVAFLMITTGYLGGIAIDGGESFTALLVFGIVSSLFFALLYVLVLLTVLRSLPSLPSAARPTYRAAMVVLMATWFVYPVVFGLQGFTSGGVWATTGQLLFCAADVVAKIGFGYLIHKVAKLRTAFDVQAGLVTHPEPLWIDGERVSEAMFPASVLLPDVETVRER